MIERNMHYPGKIPRRTCLASPVFSKLVGKWSVCFETWRGIPGHEHLVMRSLSAALFDSEDDAYSAGDRAMDMLHASGNLPNMCEKF